MLRHSAFRFRRFASLFRGILVVGTQDFASLPRSERVVALRQVASLRLPSVAACWSAPVATDVASVRSPP